MKHSPGFIHTSPGFEGGIHIYNICDIIFKNVYCAIKGCRKLKKNKLDKACIKAHNIDAILFLMLIVVGFVVSQLKYITGNHYIILTPEGKKKK